MDYERPEMASGADANWLRAEAELTADMPGSFAGSVAVTLGTADVSTFRDELASLVETLDGEATLRDLEGEVGCSITLRMGRGEFTGFVRQHIGAELRVANVPTDQSYLQASLRDFDALVEAFPVKGDPFA